MNLSIDTRCNAQHFTVVRNGRDRFLRHSLSGQTCSIGPTADAQGYYVLIPGMDAQRVDTLRTAFKLTRFIAASRGI